jgi:D-alanine-D-alanine ligase
MTDKLKVAVLMGGTSAERAVSLSTGRQVLTALDPNRYLAYALDTASLDRSRIGAGHQLSDGELSRLPIVDGAPGLMGRDGDPVTALVDLGRVAPAERPDIVFIALHGPGGEDGSVQGMLEVLGIPYTGSGVLASALAMDKAMSKRVLSAAGVLMPIDVTVRRGQPLALGNCGIGTSIAFPVIVKPNRQGSTFGITIAREADQLGSALDTAFQYDDVALIEQMIVGTEITAPILGNDDLLTLPLVEIVTPTGFYDYEAKYAPGGSDHIVPARLPASVAEKAQEIARTCHVTLGCRGMSRTDMIVTPDGIVYTLEVNTIPGMTPTSLLPCAAEAAGISFSMLLDRLIDLALENTK